MTEFLFLFRGSTRQGRSPEELQRSMQKWVAWFRELNEKGIVKDPGNPLEASGKVVRGHRKDVHDGPYGQAASLKRLTVAWPIPRLGFSVPRAASASIPISS